MNKLFIGGLLFIFIQFCLCLPFGSIGECNSSSDCSFGHCCVLGMMRYGVPRCRALGRIGQLCRMNNEPQNTTLYYPNGVLVDVSDVYTLTCPCDIGLACKNNVCAAEDAYDDNYLY
ncbi:astakine-like [Centruroides vittatus]|uniref:astakine-like n=1 Tax=Centruroides vittatus TaxID=120091 RepID=UPI00350E9D58